MGILGYSIDTGVLPVGRFPNVAKRSSCELGSLGSYFFLLSCIWITREIIATMTMQKVSNSSHVTIIVPPFNRGQKKHHPRKNRGKPPTGALLAAPGTAYHTIRQIARQKAGRIMRQCRDTPRFRIPSKTVFQFFLSCKSSSETKNTSLPSTEIVSA